MNWRIFIGIISIGCCAGHWESRIVPLGMLLPIIWLLSYGGDRDIGAARIMVTYTSLLVTIVRGLCQGLQPIIGYNYGAGNMNRLRRAFYLAVVAASVVTCVGGLYGFFWPSTIARVFTTDADLISATDRALGICLAVFPVVGFQIVSTCFFQSIGNATESIIVGLLRQVIFLIPMVIYLPRLSSGGSGREYTTGIYISV